MLGDTQIFQQLRALVLPAVGIQSILRCSGNPQEGADKVGGEVYISNVAVREKFRKRGVASALIDAMNSYCIVNNAEFITLEVRVSNTPAVNLYEKSGFENLGRRKNFYSAPNEDAFIMTKYFLKE